MVTTDLIHTHYYTTLHPHATPSALAAHVRLLYQLLQKVGEEKNQLSDSGLFEPLSSLSHGRVRTYPGQVGSLCAILGSQVSEIRPFVL